jgi:hypothetical protein
VRLQTNLLFRVWTKNDGEYENLIVIPKLESQKLIKIYHEFGTGHSSSTALFSKLKRLFYTPFLRQEINSIIDNCKQCVTFNANQRRHLEKYATMNATENFEILTVDYLGPISGHQTYKYILVAIDNYSRFAYLKATKEANNENLAIFLKEIFSKVSFYKKISCDGALCTTHSISRSLVKNLGIELEIGSPSCSRHQGKVERLIRTINTYLNKYLDIDPSIQWPKIIDMISFLYNSTPKKILGYNSPAQIHYKTSPKTYADTILKLDLEKKKDYKRY